MLEPEPLNEPLVLPLAEPLVLLVSLLATEESEDVRPVGERVSLEPVEPEPLVLPVEAVVPLAPEAEDWLASEESVALPLFAVEAVSDEAPALEVEAASEPEVDPVPAVLAVRSVEFELIVPLPLNEPEPEAEPLPLAPKEEFVSLPEVLAVEFGLDEVEVEEPLALASLLCADCAVEPNEPLADEDGELLLNPEEEVVEDGLEEEAAVL